MMRNWIVMLGFVHLIHGYMYQNLIYVGCFRDPYWRLLNTRRDVDVLTNEKCVQECGTNGHLYAGTEHANECWCGDREPSTFFAAPEEECDMGCDGDPQQMCGAGWRISVYESDLSKLSTPRTKTVSTTSITDYVRTKGQTTSEGIYTSKRETIISHSENTTLGLRTDSTNLHIDRTGSGTESSTTSQGADRRRLVTANTVSDRMNKVTDTTNIVTDKTSTVTDRMSTVTDTTRIVTDITRTVTDITNIVTDMKNIVTDMTNKVTDTTNKVTDTANIVTDTTNIVTDTTNIVTDMTNIVTDKISVATDKTSKVKDTMSIVTDTTSKDTERTSILTDEASRITNAAHIGTDRTKNIDTDTTKKETGTFWTSITTNTTSKVTDMISIVTDTTSIVSDRMNISTDTTSIVTDITSIDTDANKDTDKTRIVSDTNDIVTERTNIVTNSASPVTDATSIVTVTMSIVTDTTEKETEYLRTKEITTNKGRPASCPCCFANNTVNITKEELSIKLEKLKKQLLVQKKETSKYRAKRVCATDNRRSATYTGIILGASVLIFLCILIVVSDVFGLCSKKK